MKRYRAKITPLEPYTFGTEQGSKYAGANETGKESYIIKSSFVPEQTTILGTLRYIVLTKKGLLRSNFSYSKEEQQKIEKAIGSESFSFLKPETQSFGVIGSVSPVYLVKGEEIFVKTPFCHKPGNDEEKDEQKYKSYQMNESNVQTSYGMISLPVKYDSKEGHGRGYISLQTKKIVPDGNIFQSRLLTGNRAEKTDAKKKDGFFKREVVTLDKEYAFAVEIEAEEDSFPDKTIAYMGRRQSAFLFEFQEMGEEIPIIDKQVEDSFAEDGDEWYYVLSDLYVTDYKVEQFAIVEKKKIRNLETKIDGESYIAKRRKSSQQIHLIEAGSVFKGKPILPEEGKYKAIGYNHIIKIGRENS